MNWPKLRSVMLLLALSGLVLVEASCTSCMTSMLHNQAVGQDATDKFHRDWNSSNWDGIMIYCDPAMFKVTPEEKLRKLLLAVHNKVGNERSAERGAWRSNATTGGTYFIVQYKTHFENADGEETFTWKIYGNEAKLAGWHVNSDALLDPSVR